MDLSDYVWYWDNSNSKTHPVGQKKPNPWGLYDIHGNVSEWVQDQYYNSYDGAPTDGSAWESGSRLFRVGRGGSWNHLARKSFRSAERSFSVPGLGDRSFGFRLLQEV